MTQLFRDLRVYGLVAIMILSATVLGLAAYLGSIFLPDINRDFSIFAIIVPSLTLLGYIAVISWSQPRIDATILFILGVLWLTMGAWSADFLGSTQCVALDNQRTPTKNGSVSSKSYCYEMRVIEAFSWMIFCLSAIFLWILIALTSRSRALGRPFAWSEPVIELPWFGEWPGWPADSGPYPGYGYPMGMGYPGGQPVAYGGQPAQVVSGGYVVQQNPGHSVVIQPGMNGQAPTITQVPGVVNSV
ncbi:hypothetical protein C8Q75DRAFT_802321 [Abortiporus biennis]|nr:hypothetical protein C8Q75DRAFT_802321 [Abortiporus biennis]